MLQLALGMHCSTLCDLGMLKHELVVLEEQQQCHMSCLKPKHCVGSAAVSTHPAPGTTHPHKPLAMLYNHKNTCDKVLEEMGAQCGTAAMPANNQALGGQ